MLTTSEASRRLGVKPETLYAYVSRGLLTRHTAPDLILSTIESPDVLERTKTSRQRRR